MKRAGDISLNKKNNIWIKFLIGAAALLIFFAILNFFNSGIKNTFFAVSSPVQKIFWSAGESSSGFLSSFVNAGNLDKENQDLKNQTQQLQAEVASLQSVINGNAAQSAVSAACQNNGFKLLMAGVTGLNDQDILSINKGSEDGVSADMPVINQRGALYGKVSKVYKNYSEVTLISNKNSVISVKIQQSDLTKPEIDGVVKGSGSLGVYLDLVPIDDTINQGDVLVTSALDQTFPKDLLVGTITKVEKNDQNPHQSSQVRPFLSSSTDNLFVILNYKQ
ncbi:MAG: rod shape-determining protein MreC [Candidatus Staskawiczbacteria bacterium]|jgi:rod shape-determining protein MreC